MSIISNNDYRLFSSPFQYFLSIIPSASIQSLGLRDTSKLRGNTCRDQQRERSTSNGNPLFLDSDSLLLSSPLVVRSSFLPCCGSSWRRVEQPSGSSTRAVHPEVLHDEQSTSYLSTVTSQRERPEISTTASNQQFGSFPDRFSITNRAER